MPGNRPAEAVNSGARRGEGEDVVVEEIITLPVGRVAPGEPLQKSEASRRRSCSRRSPLRRRDPCSSPCSPGWSARRGHSRWQRVLRHLPLHEVRDAEVETAAEQLVSGSAHEREDVARVKLRLARTDLSSLRGVDVVVDWVAKLKWWSRSSHAVARAEKFETPLPLARVVVPPGVYVPVGIHTANPPMASTKGICHPSRAASGTCPRSRSCLVDIQSREIDA